MMPVPHRHLHKALLMTGRWRQGKKNQTLAEWALCSKDLASAGIFFLHDSPRSHFLSSTPYRPPTHRTPPYPPHLPPILGWDFLLPPLPPLPLPLRGRSKWVDLFIQRESWITLQRLSSCTRPEFLNIPALRRTLTTPFYPQKVGLISLPNELWFFFFHKIPSTTPTVPCANVSPTRQSCCWMTFHRCKVLYYRKRFSGTFF